MVFSILVFKELYDQVKIIIKGKYIIQRLLLLPTHVLEASLKLQLSRKMISDLIGVTRNLFHSGMRTKSWTPKRGDLWHIQSNKLLQH